MPETFTSGTVPGLTDKSYYDTNLEYDFFQLNCSAKRQDDVIFKGTMIQSVFIVIVLFMIYYFSFKTKFRPMCNFWLFWGCIDLFLWLIAKICEDFFTSKQACVPIGNLIIFTSLFGSFLNVGMCVDRCRAVYSHKPHSHMELKGISIYVLVCLCICCVIIFGNTMEITSTSKYLENPFEGCYQSSTAEIQKLKLIIKCIINLIFAVINIVTTLLTVIKILQTNLTNKVSICCNVILVVAPVTTIWIAFAGLAVSEIKFHNFSCPKPPTQNIFIYLAALPILVILLLYFRASHRLNNAFNNESGSSSTISFTGNHCFSCPVSSI
ncbi:membrane protein BILF1 [Vespertilionid gammaherpesvirus 1]|uniref:Membrane protein BILF1 n=1 Tax=Vespertilionid gammaherpesvirus 1 TaxID=2560830 RepID=A0A0X9XGT9_9GAMA|nr:membrane protein BILF1 [Myotis gammaherpesvirus 8]AMA67370.1 membrane protein BILF1 [Vespertilionid gammaherpesvirus 1]